jgi:hypothetical protein
VEASQENAYRYHMEVHLDETVFSMTTITKSDRQPGKDLVTSSLIIPVGQLKFSLKQYLSSNMARFSLFQRKNQWVAFWCMDQCWMVPVLTSCYENLTGSLIYFVFTLVRTDQVVKIFKFSTSTWFSNRAFLAYIIIYSVFKSCSHNLVLTFSSN